MTYAAAGSSCSIFRLTPVLICPFEITRFQSQVQVIQCRFQIVRPLSTKHYDLGDKSHPGIKYRSCQLMAR